MDGVAAGIPGHLQDSSDVQISGGSGLGQGARLVRQPPVQRFGVVLRKYRHRAHAEFRGSAQDANGNLAAVGNQQLAGHRGTLKKGGIRLTHRDETRLPGRGGRRRTSAAV
jgi:hypothetical protein